MKHISSSFDPQGNRVLMCDCGNLELLPAEPHLWVRFKHHPLLGALSCVTCLSCRRTETLSFRDSQEFSPLS